MSDATLEVDLVTTTEEQIVYLSALENRLNIFGVGFTPKITEEFTLNQVTVSAKFIELSSTPEYPEKSTVLIYGGVNQGPGVDYVIEGSKLDWAGLAMETLLEVGMRIQIIYS
jgi:hypothetical protein